MADETKKDQDATEELLSEIREDFRYHKEYWSDAHDEAAKDMDTVACIPPPEFKDDRKGRPCIWPDEISQYVKQANNNLRQNKRSAKISPKSEDATDEDAEHREAYMRGIEDASKAQSIYTTAAESAIECSFGFWRIKTVITGPKGEQEPRLARVPNQFAVLPDPDALEADFSDQNKCFVLGPPMRPKKFTERFKHLNKGQGPKLRSFTESDVQKAPDWFDGGNIVPAEYFRREEIEEKDGEKRYKVTQHITNGLEILETNEWLGSWIPIIGVFGEELYIRSSGQVKRLFLSLVRRARAPQQMLAYIASQEAEEFGMAPRAPILVVEGSVDPDKWKYAHQVPTAYLEYKIPQDWNAQIMGPFPAPVRHPFEPNAQAYQLSRESWRRAVQAAMGLTPLPTAAQRQNEKSGVALEKIQTQEAIGSYHFTDNFVRALNNSCRQVNELITKLAEHDSLPGRVLGKNKKGEDLTLHVTRNAPPLDPASEQIPEAKYFFAHRGQFELTIADAPSYQSEREEGSALADKVFETVAQLAQVLPPNSVGKLLAMAIRLKNIGALGDEMADVLDPKDSSAQQLAQAQQQIAEAQKVAAAMQAELQKLQIERAGKVIDNEYKAHMKQMELSMDAKLKQLDVDLKAYIANVQTKAQDVAQRTELFHETQTENHHAAHEVALQKDQQAHEHALADKAAATAAATQASDQAHQQTMAAQSAAAEPPAGEE